MPTVLERVRKLIALAASSNENEARNASHLAVRLIREHGVILSMPASSAVAPKKKTPRSKRNAAIPDPPQRIKSPLGGECIHCGARYRAGAEVFWFPSGGGMHPPCFAAWAKTR